LGNRSRRILCDIAHVEVFFELEPSLNAPTGASQDPLFVTSRVLETSTHRIKFVRAIGSKWNRLHPQLTKALTFIGLLLR
jgi:hypothetical protein